MGPIEPHPGIDRGKYRYLDGPCSLISRDAGNEAVDNLGKVEAAAVLAIIYQRYSDDVAKGTLSIRNSGGYFRSMARRAPTNVKSTSKPNSANSDDGGWPTSPPDRSADLFGDERRKAPGLSRGRCKWSVR